MKKNNFKLKQKVKVIRHKHGWTNGSLQGTIKTINSRHTGTFYYTVICNKGVEYTILKPKDIKNI